MDGPAAVVDPDVGPALPAPRARPAGPDSAEGCAWLTALGAVATAEVVTAWTGREAAIKWPNDVRVDGRKIAGILVECPSPQGRAAVIGIGLNVNVDREALPADLRAGRPRSGSSAAAG